MHSECQRASRPLVFLLALAFLLLCQTMSRAQQRLVNGKTITPLGNAFPVGSLPMNMIASPDGRYALVVSMGDREAIWSLSTATGKGLSHIDYPRPESRSDINGVYYGLAIDGGNTLYASQGILHKILVAKLASDGTLTPTGAIQAGADDFTAGVALDHRGYLYVVNKEFYNTENTRDPLAGATPSSLSVYSTASGREVGRIPLVALTIPSALGPIAPPESALVVAALPDGSRVFVTDARDGLVFVVNATHPAKPTVVAKVATGSHPDALLLDRGANRLYVANAGSDTVSVLDTHALKVLDTILLRPDEVRGLPGATPTGLALSPDQKTLYATLGDMNSVAVADLRADRLTGYIPAGWYPSAVLATQGGKLLVANAYGTKTRYPNGHLPGFEWYDLNLIEGDVSTFPVPTPARLRADTREVLANNRLASAGVSRAEQLASIGLKPGEIKHVIYIIKENRTYDQVMGDDPQGNGDPTLTLFGSDVTPNQHALADRFVLFDNFYDCGEVSGIGWPWSTQGIANEYVVKNIPYDYSGRSRDYDFEGQVDGYPVGGFPANDPYGNPLSQAFPQGAPAIPDIGEAAGGHIWDEARKAGLSYRNYGFFYTFGVKGIIPDNYPDSPGLQPAGHDLGGISDIDYHRFDNDYPDSDAPSIYYAKDHNADCLYELTAYGHYDMPSRFDEWNREFDEMLAKAPDGSAVPALITIRLPHDHTQGAQSGRHSPRSEVADNDYGVGQIVEAVSKSPIWKSTAIFIVEDDSQDGQDHVDCHRSTCFIISPWMKAGAVDHAFYNTDSILRTIEIILNLPPMSQYDAVAPPFADWDSAPNNSAPYAPILPAESIIAEHNPSEDSLAPTDSRRRLAALSDKLDFSRPDSAPAQLVDLIVWQTVHGPRSIPPAPRFGLVLPGAKDDDDD